LGVNLGIPVKNTPETEPSGANMADGVGIRTHGGREPTPVFKGEYAT
jgi:hypothetical protein